MKIGKNITDKKTAGLTTPKESQDFQKFKEQRSKRVSEEQEEKLVSRMPDEKQPSDDTMSDEMAKLGTEKGVFSRQRALQDIKEEGEDNEI